MTTMLVLEAIIEDQEVLIHTCPELLHKINDSPPSSSVRQTYDDNDSITAGGRIIPVQIASFLFSVLGSITILLVLAMMAISVWALLKIMVFLEDGQQGIQAADCERTRQRRSRYIMGPIHTQVR
jgi:hypothetical protein